jgi:hypothetical protein
MPNLRTGNKRHNRAITRQVAKAAEATKAAPAKDAKAA